ncbi:hypothetical protein C1646_764564 [Rhizophagus diaphanus]|nr:hypothetical protein C1646_764564 [Rhizophagus diaphanus] [Rhizophagus sp. MUCL 43196]
MEQITLFCLVYGVTPVEDRIFPIHISRNNTIAELCDMIVEKRHDNYSGENLTLWKMKKPIAVDGTDGRVTILNKPFDPSFNIGNTLGGIKMSALDEIYTHFSTNLDKKHIHIIVQCPDERKEIHCSVIHGRKKSTFQWIITRREELTLDLLKGQICAHFPLLYNTKKEYISIYRNGHDKKVQTSFKISDDNDLMKVAWSSFYRTSLELFVETPQQAFSNWSFQLLRDAFKLNTSSWDTLAEFQGQRCDVTQYQQSIDYIVYELIRRQVTLPYIPTANEATRREFISCVLHGVAYCFNGKIKVVPEYEIAGPFGRAIQRNLRLRSSGGHTSTELYGIVTTALEWFIIKVIETDCIEEPIDVKISNLTPINLPLTDRKLSKDKLLEPVKDLFSQILWIFNDQF